MRRIETAIDIDVDVDTAWSVLVDFPNHAEWNPFMRRIQGEPVSGARLTVELAPPGGKGMTFRPTVTAAEPPHRFEWVGHLGIPGLFDGRHEFVLDPRPEGRSRLTHRETFRGLLVPLVWRSMSAPTAEGFEQFNDGFALRCRDIATRRVPG